MKIKHPAIKTNLLRLVETFELDVNLGPELNFPLRMEIFQDTGKRGWFRAHVWEQESFNLEPTFPVKRNGKTLRYKSSESLLLERATQLTGDYKYFKAKNAADALGKVIKDLKGRLAHWTGTKAT